MPEFRYANAAVHYGDNGNGAPLLLLHSGGSSGAQWRKAGEKLTARRLLTPDFYGYGGTDGWDSDETLQHEDQADLVVAALTHADLADSTVYVVGHSYGGASAVRIVLRELANVRSSLVLIEPMLAPLLAEAGENKLFGEYEFLAHVFLDRIRTGTSGTLGRFSDTSFAEGYPEDEQPIDTPDGDSYARYGANMLPVDYKSSSPVSPLFAYPYARAW